jgi:hypothetical protein
MLPPKNGIFGNNNNDNVLLCLIIDLVFIIKLYLLNGNIYASCLWEVKKYQRRDE